MPLHLAKPSFRYGFSNYATVFDTQVVWASAVALAFSQMQRQLLFDATGGSQFRSLDVDV